MRRTPELSPRKIPTQARAKATYSTILQAAARILEREGYEKLTTNRVAEVAGIGIASLYEYFPNKQSVVAAVITANVEEVLHDIEVALEKAITQAPEEGLATWISAMFVAMDKRRALAATLLREVPFLYDVPAMRQLRKKLLGLAARGHVLAPTLLQRKRLDAIVYLLPLMVSSAVVEVVLRPPKTISRPDI
ncbi:MAG TPA: helix-turn-helix domain-containing protein, partial [Polyangiales bacterium]|nr:helix-turn-helix domain-containing protein [Polyangiales bacterium]